jgi:hypothetical protein
MTKSQILDVIKLLSSLQSWGFVDKHNLPDYLQENISETMEILSKELLK